MQEDQKVDDDDHEIEQEPQVIKSTRNRQPYKCTSHMSIQISLMKGSLKVS